MMLSPHFSLDELTVSQTAARHVPPIDNAPPAKVVAALTNVAVGLEGVRIALGAPIIINSGYRSPELNKAVGGAKNSQHLAGEAVDFICPGFGTPHQIVARLIKSGINFDQLIVEFGAWVHVSFTKSPRRQVLVIDHSGTRAWA